jgi:acyl-CoA hydrolase
VTALCTNDDPLPSPGKVELDEMSRIIGGYIADEVPHEATFQLGIGAIPEAVGLALRDKRNLGIHTELLTDSMIELIRCGAVTNARKPIHTGKTVATLSYGSQDMYDYIHENDDIEFLPVDYTNDPAVIAQHPCFMSVNGALAVDFYGQVCAESLGTKHVSGTGGQADYVRGAVASPGGKSFIAFTSTIKNDTISRIGATLPTGSIVSTSKNDVDYIVTEYGIAKLRGKTVSQRTKALINIAHPKFREELTREAKKRNIII